MKIINQTTNSTIATDAYLATTIKDRTIGLIKSPSSALVLKTRFGIHTFFMKKPIDVLILDRSLKVVKIKKNLIPNNLLFWNPIYDLVIELPANSLSKTKIGHQITFDPKPKNW